MKQILISIFILIGFTAFTQNSSFTQNKKSEWPAITMINHIEFNDGSFAPSYPGCSFLLDTGEDTLAVSCKHSLWTGKNEHMHSISIDNQVKTWRMHIKNDTTQYVIADKLINTNPDEKIEEWNTEKDYLVFTIKENHSTIQPLKLSPIQLQESDKVYKIGWAFKDREGPQRVYTSYFQKYLGNAALIQDSIFENQAGTSGSPVINQNGELVGIVSSWKFDQASGKWYGAPCSTDYLWEVLFKYWLSKIQLPKNPDNFFRFVAHYEKLNNCNVEFSDNLFMNLFFYDWLTENNINYGTLKQFNVWNTLMTEKYNKNILLPEETLNKLKFNEWKNNYINQTSNLNDLDQKVKQHEFYIDISMLCKFGIDLVEQNKFNQSIELFNYTIQQFPKNGQIYYYLAEAYLTMGNIVKAKENYHKCLELYPGYPFAIEKLNQLKH